MITPLHPDPSEDKKADFHLTYEDFYRDHYAMVINYLRFRCHSLQDAEDIASQVFTYCYFHWTDYNPQKASAKTWLFLIVRSRWIEFRRKQKICADIDELSNILTDEKDPIEQAMTLDSIRQELAKALTALPQNLRAVVVLRYFSDDSDELIAKKLHTTRGNVRVMASRAIKKMQPMLSFSLNEGEQP